MQTAIGTVEERKAALNILLQGKKIVMTTLTVELLICLEIRTGVDVISCLEKSGLKFIVSEYLLDYLNNEKKQPVSAGTLALVDNHPRMFPDNYGLKRTNLLVRYITFLGNCDCILGNILSNMDEDEDGFSMCKVLGRAYYHALMIASADNDAILWDDDAVTMDICQHFDGKFKVHNRIFTQILFEYLHKSGCLQDKDQTTINTFLLSMKMRFTWCDSATVVNLVANPAARSSTAFEELCWYLSPQNNELDINSARRVCIDSVRKLAESREYTSKDQKVALKTLAKKFSHYNKQLLEECLFDGLKTAIESRRSTIQSYDTIQHLSAYLPRSKRKLLLSIMKCTKNKRKLKST
jgi:hypothetical protein